MLQRIDPRAARRTLLVALLLGIGADILFDRNALGINVPIAVAVVLAVATLLRPRPASIDRLDLWLPVVAIATAAALAVRADPTLVRLDGLIAILATVAWCVALSGFALTRSALAVVVQAGVLALARVGIGAVELADRGPRDGSLGAGFDAIRRRAPIVRGLLVAIPIVAIFAMLFASADAVFGRLVGDLLHVPVDLGDLLARTAFALAAAWVVAGALALVVGGLPLELGGARSLGAAARTRDVAGGALLRGATEALIVLLAVDTLFAVFVVLQLAYLFGGLDTVAATGMTFSDYARRGYFELVAVVVFAGILVAVAAALAGRARGFVPAAIALVVLTSVVLASAAIRLGLYQQIYGWTELRFYVVASIAWLGLALALTLGLLASRRMRWLLHGLAFGAMIVTLVVSAIGPQSFITAQNIARVLDPSLVPPEGRAGLDTAYLSTFGDDAIPQLVAVLPRLRPQERDVLETALRDRKAELDADDGSKAWPAWNLARERAREALASIR